MSVTWQEATSPVRLVFVGGRNVVVNGGFETGDYSGWGVSDVGGPYTDEAYEGTYFTSIAANRYSGQLWQTLPVTEFSVLRFAFRFRAPSPYQQLGGVGFELGAGVRSGLDIYVKYILDSNLQVEICGWEGVIPAAKDAAGWWDSGWHILTAKRAAESYYDVYLDGIWISQTQITSSDVLYVDATGLTTSIITGQFDFDDVKVITVEYIVNGGFEAGTLDPWYPVLGAYAACTYLVVDAYEGAYCLHAGPTRVAHGATYCGVQQDITEISAPFMFSCAFKKLNPEKKDAADIGPVHLQFTGSTDDEISFTAYRAGTVIGSGTITKDWNILEVRARETEFDVVVNGVNMATVSESLTVNSVRIGTGVGTEYEGGSYHFDAVSLTK